MLSLPRPLFELVNLTTRPPGMAVGLPIGVCELFKVGIGPSSSHTIGPMKAAATFVRRLGPALQGRTSRIQATAFGSLAWTGKGHATDKALILGLAGYLPDSIDPDEANKNLDHIRSSHSIVLPNGCAIEFRHERDVIFDTLQIFDRHPNAMQFEAFDAAHFKLATEVWFSIGGGFVERDGEQGAEEAFAGPFGFDFRSSDELLSLCRANNCTISEVAMVNELARRTEVETFDRIDRIINVMMACIDRGLSQEGELPGGLRVRRRAKELFQKLNASRLSNTRSSSEAFDYVSAFAIAVNEENASAEGSSRLQQMALPELCPRSFAITATFALTLIGQACAHSSWRPPRSAGLSSAMHQFPVQKWDARAKLVRQRRWQAPDLRRRSVAQTSRSRTRLRSPWSIISA